MIGAYIRPSVLFVFNCDKTLCACSCFALLLSQSKGTFKSIQTSCGLSLCESVCFSRFYWYSSTYHVLKGHIRLPSFFYWLINLIPFLVWQVIVFVIVSRVLMCQWVTGCIQPVLFSTQINLQPPILAIKFLSLVVYVIFDSCLVLVFFIFIVKITSWWFTLFHKTFLSFKFNLSLIVFFFFLISSYFPICVCLWRLRLVLFHFKLNCNVWLTKFLWRIQQ